MLGTGPALVKLAIELAQEAEREVAAAARSGHRPDADRALADLAAALRALEEAHPRLVEAERLIEKLSGGDLRDGR